MEPLLPSSPNATASSWRCAGAPPGPGRRPHGPRRAGAAPGRWPGAGWCWAPWRSWARCGPPSSAARLPEGPQRHHALGRGWVWALRPLFRRLGLEEAWILSFCAWNNHRVRRRFKHRKARRALVLLPHCIQMARCKADVLTDLSNCYECGLCPVGDFLPAAAGAGLGEPHHQPQPQGLPGGPGVPARPHRRRELRGPAPQGPRQDARGPLLRHPPGPAPPHVRRHHASPCPTSWPPWRPWWNPGRAPRADPALPSGGDRLVAPPSGPGKPSRAWRAPPSPPTCCTCARWNGPS